LEITGILRSSSEAWNHKFNLIGVSLTKPFNDFFTVQSLRRLSGARSDDKWCLTGPAVAAGAGGQKDGPMTKKEMHQTTMLSDEVPSRAGSLCAWNGCTETFDGDMPVGG